MAVLYLLGGGAGVTTPAYNPAALVKPEAEPQPEPLTNAATAAHSEGSK